MGIFKDKNLYSILNGSYNSIVNKYIVKDENLKSDLVTSGATVIGNNVENLLEQESLLKEMHSNNEIEKLLPMLIDYPQHFVTSFLSFIKEICDWSPLDPKKENNDENYRKYLSILLSSPLFLVETSSTHKIYYDNNNYKDLLAKILQQYQNVSEQEKKYINLSLKTLIRHSVANITDKNSGILFTHTVLNSESDVVRLYLYSAEIKISYDEENKKYKPTEESAEKIEISRIELKFLNSSVSADDMKLIIGLRFIVLSDWVAQNNMLPQKMNRKLCID
ncbi:hypothetical protein [Arsenophonus sp.]|uniref:hypothetical protein n=1 Tax=Arsenophonus sp. TaxID=1872640 RepID=UPI00285E2E00|nr:hypothetical protein [Arsenophonus sp.]MDR5617638.1 hypothetical protein [Arsenophonus sp.]